jgi:hypothetical protein
MVRGVSNRELPFARRISTPLEYIAHWSRLEKSAHLSDDTPFKTQHCTAGFFAVP